MAGYRQTRQSLPGKNQPRKVKTSTNRVNVWQPTHANTISTGLCMTNGLLSGYITDKRNVSSCKICLNSSEFYYYYLV